jgi:hypothetical protein
MEAYGFQLGDRDREARTATTWNPAASSEMFRSGRSFYRNKSRMVENSRLLRKAASTPLLKPKPEDVRGEPEEEDGKNVEFLKRGKTHGSRSCPYWDRYDHACRREAAKLSAGTFSPSLNSHQESYPFKGHLELSPASVYSLKFQQQGEGALRDRPAFSKN